MEKGNREVRTDNMSENRHTPPGENRATVEYYRLHTGAVEALAGADEGNSPEVSAQELQRYRSGPRLRLTDAARAILIKMWFAGSVCFFVFWGLSAYIAAPELLLVFGVALGLVTDFLTNGILRSCAGTPEANDPWMMFPQKRRISFLYNILYALVLLFCVSGFYTLLNLTLSAVAGSAEGVTVGVGPILFGAVYTAFDLLFIQMKRLLRRIVSDAKEKEERS